MENNKPDFIKLEDEKFGSMADNSTWSDGCEYVWSTYVVPLQERLTLEKESNDLLHQAMTSAESRGVQKGREEMDSDNKALREENQRLKERIPDSPVKNLDV